MKKKNFMIALAVLFGFSSGIGAFGSPLAIAKYPEKEIKFGRFTEAVRTVLLRFTPPANLTGLPAISVPCGFSHEKLPIGMQLLGRRFDEGTLLRVAYAYEQATPWHTLFPAESEKKPHN